MHVGKLKLILFLLVLLFTFILRAHNYERVPTANHLDEMLYAWSGIYLIETGVPVSWSTLEYPDRAEVFRGEINFRGGLPKSTVTLYKPWLDEPPLFSLLVGYFAHQYGADRNQFIPSSYIRLPMIFISALTSILVFLIARKTSGYWLGLLSMFLYGTIPILVFASRVALPETLIACIFAIIIYLLLKFRDKLKPGYLLPIPLLVGIAGLSKPTGFFLLPYALFFVFYYLYRAGETKRALRYCFHLIIFTLPFIVLFREYGNYFDPEIFKRITEIQSTRPSGFGALGFILTTPSFGTTELRDSWYVFLLVSAGYFLFSLKDSLKQVVLFSFTYWIIVVMLTGGEWDLLAWYRFPALPMLAILGAWGLVEIVRRADFFASFLGIGLLLGNRRLLVNAFHKNTEALTHRLIFAGLMVPSTLNYVFNKKSLLWFSRGVLVLVIVVGIYFNVSYVYSAFDLECQSKTCPIVPSTFISTLHFPVIWRLFVIGE